MLHKQGNKVMGVPKEVSELVRNSDNNFHVKVARWFSDNEWHVVVSPSPRARALPYKTAFFRKTKLRRCIFLDRPGHTCPYL
jgi:hypothetical protein